MTSVAEWGYWGMRMRFLQHPVPLWVEFIFFFVGIPGWLVHLQLQGGILFFETLLGLTAVTLLIGALDPGVRFREPGSWSAARGRLRLVLTRAALGGVLMLLGTRLIWPEFFLRLVLERPRLWMMVMILYPLLSVAPQEYIFRVYFMQRYRPIFGSGAGMMWMNALIFGWAHVFFLNPVAPILSVAGGWLFADTWRRTRNFRLVCLEHAIYGQLVFTAGLGWFFYNGSAQAVERMVE